MAGISQNASGKIVFFALPYSNMAHIRIFLYLLWCFAALTVSAQCVSTTEWQQIIPAENLPAQVKSLKAHNNLDVALFKGRYYVAFRTAPSHFASPKVRMYIVSTTDFSNWQFEQEFWLKSDMREPRFFQNNDTLFFTFFKAGTNMFRFQPRGIFETFLAGGNWSPLQELQIHLGYVPWRTKRHNGLFYMSTYNGTDEYKLNTQCESRVLVSKDGIHWDSLSKEPQILHPRATAENEFVFMPNGDLWGVSRLEYDGSYIYHASKDSIHKWETWYSKHKFDSPLMFVHNGVPYLIARRNLDGDGTYYRKDKKYKKNLIRYSLNRKTTALYALDTAAKALVHVMDFPSTGDCAFAGITPINDSTYYVLNYSSNIHKRPKNWLRGQLGRTYIYKTKLTFGNCGLEALDRKLVYQFK